MATSHPIWGVPLDEYIRSNPTDHTLYKISNEIISEEQLRTFAQNVIDEICEEKDVSVTKLESIMTLSHSPDTYTMFEDPALIHGCIKLLAGIKIHERAAPFSYHYGYLIFRILIISLGACILARTDSLDNVIDAMIDDPDTELILTFSAYVASTLREEADMSFEGNECNWILGWDHASDDEPLGDGESSSDGDLILVSKSDAQLLLDMLWEDRTSFLTIAASVYTPGMSAIMFVLWRYVSLEESSKLWAPFSDLLWRCCLASTSDQHVALVPMNHDANEMIDIWDESPKIANVDDFRALVNTYNNRLTPADTPLYQPLEITAIAIFLRFVVANFCPGSEDLIPALFRVTMIRVWTIIDGKPDIDTKFSIVSSLGDVFEFFGELMEHMCKDPDSNSLAFSQVLEVLVQNDLVNLIACGMLFMRPTKKGPSEDLTANLALVHHTCEMLLHPWNFRPRLNLESTFAKSIPDWQKVMTYFEQRQILLNKPIAYSSHFAACVSSWRTIGMGIGQPGAMDTTKRCPLPCVYARCPDPSPAAGVQLMCALCLEAGYCSARCQKADWIYKERPDSHKTMCSGRVRLAK